MLAGFSSTIEAIIADNWSATGGTAFTGEAKRRSLLGEQPSHDVDRLVKTALGQHETEGLD